MEGVDLGVVGLDVIDVIDEGIGIEFLGYIIEWMVIRDVIGEVVENLCIE